MADNGIIGDISGTDLPELVPDEQGLNEEKKMARYSKSSEFKRIKQHFNERVAFYQRYLPGGVPINTVSQEEREKMWIVADTIITELQTVLDSYEIAAEAVKDAS